VLLGLSIFRRWGEYQHRRPAASLPLLLPGSLSLRRRTPPRQWPPTTLTAAAAPLLLPPPEDPLRGIGRGGFCSCSGAAVSACGIMRIVNRPMTRGERCRRRGAKRKLDGSPGKSVCAIEEKKKAERPKPAATRLVVVARYPRPPQSVTRPDMQIVRV